MPDDRGPSSQPRSRPGKSVAASILPGPLLQLEAGLRRRWDAMQANARGALLVSLGSLTLVVMAGVVKVLGQRLPSFEILFFRSFVGLLFVLPLFVHDPWEPFRTRNQIGHFARGAWSAVGNGCFFWTITHLLLADAMALQFSRPLFMIPLAVLFLGETAGWRRIAVTLVGFVGILLYARPFTGGFDAGVFVGALGALGGGMVLICIKQLARTEPTRVIMFYYALWNIILGLPFALWDWTTPTWPELALLIVVGFLGISGQSLMTTGFTIGQTTALVPLDYFRIVYAAIFAWALFGELPDIWSYAGMAVIISSSLYLVLTEKKPDKKTA